MERSERKRLKVVLPGGSGNVGHLLAKCFHDRGDQVTVLSRHPAPAPWTVLQWDAKTSGPWTQALQGVDVCINLTGRSVNTRATEKHREEIYRSRIDSTRLLGQVISALPEPPRVWLNASTATIYRHALDRGMDEATGELGGREPNVPRSWDFSIKVGRDWEQTFFAAVTPHTRRVALRTSLVMSPDPGSVFSMLSRLVRLGLGGKVGGGRQHVSWIHAHDFLRAVDLLIQDENWEGVVNLSAPTAPTNQEFMSTLCRAWNMPVGLPATEWMIAIGTFLLRTESELVLKSRWVVPGRLQAAGFQYEFPEWAEAARDLVGQTRRSKHTSPA